MEAGRRAGRNAVACGDKDVYGDDRIDKEGKESVVREGVGRYGLRQESGVVGEGKRQLGWAEWCLGKGEGVGRF